MDVAESWSDQQDQDDVIKDQDDIIRHDLSHAIKDDMGVKDDMSDAKDDMSDAIRRQLWASDPRTLFIFYFIILS